jgi:hypothetical protein
MLKGCVDTFDLLQLVLARLFREDWPSCHQNQFGYQ